MTAGELRALEARVADVERRLEELLELIGAPAGSTGREAYPRTYFLAARPGAVGTPDAS